MASQISQHSAELKSSSPDIVTRGGGARNGIELVTAPENTDRDTGASKKSSEDTGELKLTFRRSPPRRPSFRASETRTDLLNQTVTEHTLLSSIKVYRRGPEDILTGSLVGTVASEADDREKANSVEFGTPNTGHSQLRAAVKKPSLGRRSVWVEVGGALVPVTVDQPEALMIGQPINILAVIRRPRWIGIPAIAFAEFGGYPNEAKIAPVLEAIGVMWPRLVFLGLCGALVAMAALGLLEPRLINFA